MLRLLDVWGIEFMADSIRGYCGYCVLARWLEAVSSTLVVMVTRARKFPGRQEVLPCCGEDVVDIEHWRLGGQHTHR